jgi:hypothetical protein
MYCVQISARIISWPRVCACCCQPADTSVEVSSTRVTGKKVIHTQTKSWDVPYCRRCLAHIEAGKALKRLSMVVIHLSGLFGLVGGALAIVGFAAVYPRSVLIAIVLGLLLAAATTTVVILTFSWCRAKYQRDVQAKKAQRAKLEQQLNALLCQTCCVADQLAAKYDGWHGSVHTFFFANREFASAFRRINPGKCLQDGQIHH